MLQKTLLTISMLVVSTTSVTLAEKSLCNTALTQRNVRAPWQYATLVATDAALVTHFLAHFFMATNPAVSFPVTCVVVAGSVAMMVAPDDVKDAITNTGTQTIAAVQHAKAKVRKHLEKTDTTFVKYVNGWRP